jgi:hypothetical protein
MYRYCAACGCNHRKPANHWHQFFVRNAEADDAPEAVCGHTNKVYGFAGRVCILAEHHGMLRLPAPGEPHYICLKQYNIITNKKRSGAVAPEPQDLDPATLHRVVNQVLDTAGELKQRAETAEHGKVELLGQLQQAHEANADQKRCIAKLASSVEALPPLLIEKQQLQAKLDAAQVHNRRLQQALHIAQRLQQAAEAQTSQLEAYVLGHLKDSGVVVNHKRGLSGALANNRQLIQRLHGQIAYAHESAAQWKEGCRVSEQRLRQLQAHCTAATKLENRMAEAAKHQLRMAKELMEAKQQLAAVQADASTGRACEALCLQREQAHMDAMVELEKSKEELMQQVLQLQTELDAADDDEVWQPNGAWLPNPFATAMAFG